MNMMAEFFNYKIAIDEDAVKGIVINSAKRFIAGGDLKWFYYDKSKEECFDMLMQTNTYLRKARRQTSCRCHKRTTWWWL
jgi:3-hydroxyacyl-CoA dehydrogenase/enoyl-CoA hydratase/3-hydroxybutyryl-CoA epimerase